MENKYKGLHKAVAKRYKEWKAETTSLLKTNTVLLEIAKLIPEEDGRCSFDIYCGNPALHVWGTQENLQTITSTLKARFNCVFSSQIIENFISYETKIYNTTLTIFHTPSDCELKEVTVKQWQVDCGGNL